MPPPTLNYEEPAMRVLSDRECHARLSEFRQETRNAGGNTKAAKLIIEQLNRV